MGGRAYRYLSLYEPAPGCLVEVGSERGEGSTLWLANWARRHRLKFYTADIDPDVYSYAREITCGARNTSGRSLLRRLRTEISVAYLDGFDWIPVGQEDEEWIRVHRNRYADLGFELNNRNCQLEHAVEAQLVASKAADRCVVICDDTWLNGSWDGKGGLAVPFLQGQGFRVMDIGEREEESLGFVVLKRG